jgi:hypothetical protein
MFCLAETAYGVEPVAKKKFELEVMGLAQVLSLRVQLVIGQLTGSG